MQRTRTIESNNDSTVIAHSEMTNRVGKTDTHSEMNNTVKGGKELHAILEDKASAGIQTSAIPPSKWQTGSPSQTSVSPSSKLVSSSSQSHKNYLDNRFCCNPDRGADPTRIT